MTAIEDAMQIVLDALARLDPIIRRYEGDLTLIAVRKSLMQARYDIESDPGYQRDRTDRSRAMRERLGMDPDGDDEAEDHDTLKEAGE